MNGWIDGCMIGCTEEWMNHSMSGWMDGCVDGSGNGDNNGFSDEWVD